jgi:hypothetical protein
VNANDAAVVSVGVAINLVSAAMSRRTGRKSTQRQSARTVAGDEEGDEFVSQLVLVKSFMRVRI